MNYYEEFEALAGISLEESWMLEVAPRTNGMAFRIEAVLTPEHPRYSPPKRGEQHCYLRGWLDVRSAKPVELHLSGSPPATDADDSIDFGHIDVFIFNEADNQWEMDGGWGTARFSEPVVTLVFD